MTTMLDGSSGQGLSKNSMQLETAISPSVNGPLANLPQFAEAFECKAGDPMVREGEKRCEVW